LFAFGQCGMRQHTKSSSNLLVLLVFHTHFHALAERHQLCQCYWLSSDDTFEKKNLKLDQMCTVYIYNYGINVLYILNIGKTFNEIPNAIKQLS